MRRRNDTVSGEVTFSQGAFFILTLVLCLGFTSCSFKKKATSSNLISRFDLVDALISQGQNRDALKELKKISSKVYESWSYIGVYKRYNVLGEKVLAEKTLQKGLKKAPKNPELSAVYAKFLLAQNRPAEAEKISECLQTTRYASVYAESVFKNHSEEISDRKPSLLYEDRKYFDLYKDSYNTSRNPVWLRNCAVVCLVKGQYDAASDFTPQAYNDSDDAYFWAQVNFDGGNYYQTVNACEVSLYFMESMKKTASRNASKLKVVALESDAYNLLADSANAHSVREQIIVDFITGRELRDRLSDEEKEILPLVVVNSAVEEKKRGNGEKSSSLLTYSVMNFPEFVPGLIAYADFAWESNLGRREDDEMTALRKAGIKSLEMERYDSRAKIPLSDALYRIDQALMKIKDPYLYIKRLDLRYKADPKLTVRDKTADLWRLLEESSTDSVKYHDILVRYTVNFLLENGMTEDAEMIFTKYLSTKYGLDPKNPKVNFYDQIADNTRNIETADLEPAAYFAVMYKKTDDALRMFEYSVFESSGIRSADISSQVTTETAMNLANLYYGLALKDKALDLYGKIASRESVPVKRSAAFYRIASIYYAFGDNQNALRSADYACSIYPENAQAHLLKTRLTSK